MIIPRAAFASLLRHEQGQAEHYNDRGHYGRIRHVEGRIAGEVYEVGNVTKAYAVDEIAERAAQQQPQRGGHERVLNGRKQEEKEYGGEADDGGDRQETGLALKNAERGPCIGHVGEVYGPILRPGLANLKPATH